MTHVIASNHNSHMECYHKYYISLHVAKRKTLLDNFSFQPSILLEENQLLSELGRRLKISSGIAHAYCSKKSSKGLTTDSDMQPKSGISF